MVFQRLWSTVRQHFVGVSLAVIRDSASAVSEGHVSQEHTAQKGSTSTVSQEGSPLQGWARTTCHMCTIGQALASVGV